jgi:flagellum-specific peptidoglycan hydrolase FlgJ
LDYFNYDRFWLFFCNYYEKQGITSRTIAMPMKTLSPSVWAFLLTLGAVTAGEVSPSALAPVPSSDFRLASKILLARTAARVEPKTPLVWMEWCSRSGAPEQGAVAFVLADHPGKACLVRINGTEIRSIRPVSIPKNHRPFVWSDALSDFGAISGTTSTFAKTYRIQADEIGFHLSCEDSQTSAIWQVTYRFHGNNIGVLRLFPKFGAFASYHAFGSSDNLLSRLHREIDLPRLPSIRDDTNQRMELHFAKHQAPPTAWETRLSPAEENRCQQILATTREASQQEFLRVMIPLALQIKKDFGVPASATVAMAAYESHYGQSRLATEHFNFFGLKALDPTWDKARTRMTTRDEGIAQLAWFRSYGDFLSGVRGYGEFLAENQRYRGAFASADGLSFVQKVLKAGYCPDSDYLGNIQLLMQRHQLRELDVDTAVSVATQGTSPTMK